MIQLDPGAHIFYRNNKYIDDLEFVVLEDKSATRGTFVCVLDKPLKDEMSFDEYGNNEWATSSLRKYLNEEYIEHFNKNDIVQLGNGDYITLLSKEEVKRYKDILPTYSTFWWTRSPCVSCARNAWYANSSGQVNHSYAIIAIGVAPACTFNLNNLTIFPEGNDIIFESKN